METEVTATKFSLFGIEPILWSMEKEILLPLKIQRYGAVNRLEQDRLAGLKPSPKFILISGHRGSGKRAVTSVLVNELRRGPLTKSADVFYNERDVKYFTLDPYNSGDRDVIPDLRALFAGARSPTDGRDFTVISMPNFDYVCPRDRSVEEEEQQQPQLHDRRRRRRGRSPQTVELINALVEELDKTPSGRLLLVGQASEPEEVDTVLTTKVEYRYAIPYPTANGRREMIPEFMEELRMDYASDMGFFVRYTEGNTPGQIRRLLDDVKAEARYRIQNERRRAGVVEGPPPPNNEPSGEPIVLIKSDFINCMDDFVDADYGDQGQDRGQQADIRAHFHQPPLIDLAEEDEDDEGVDGGGDDDDDDDDAFIQDLLGGVNPPPNADDALPANLPLGLDQLRPLLEPLAADVLPPNRAPFPGAELFLMENPIPDRLQELVQEMLAAVHPFINELQQQQRAQDLQPNGNNGQGGGDDEDDNDDDDDNASDSSSNSGADDDNNDPEGGNNVMEEPMEQALEVDDVDMDGEGDDDDNAMQE